MISCPTLVRRSWFTPAAILVAIVALLGGAYALNRDAGSKLETVADESVLDSATSITAEALASEMPPAAPIEWWRQIDSEDMTSPSTAGDPAGAAAANPDLPAVPVAASDPTLGSTSPASPVGGAVPPASGAPAASTPGAVTPGTGAAASGQPATTTAATTRPATTASTSRPATTAAASVPAAPSNCSNPWANLAGCGWPGPGNTGPRSGNCPNGLSTNAGGTTRQIPVTGEGTVVSCQRITGSLVISGHNVTVRDSVITYDGGGGTGGGAIVVDDGASATIDHVEVDGMNHTHTCVWYQGTSVTIDGLNCHGTDDGVFAWARTAYSSTSGDNFTIRNSYFHDFTHNAANGHIDGFQTEGAANGVISHNTFLMEADANSAISIWDSAKSSNNIAITGNLMTGGGFTVYAEDYSPSESSPGGGNSVTNITFTNNVFSTKAAGCVGTWDIWYDKANLPYRGGPTDGWHRSGNKVLETGQNVDQGNFSCRP